jgi:DNA-binding transcriptional LysR family regulator
MTLQQLHYIVEVSKCNSITAAAQNLFIAQPSLSKSIKELESEFGITILERNRHGVSFTMEGREFLGFATRILEQASNMRDHFNHDQEQEEELHLSLSSQHYMFAVEALVDFIKKSASRSRYTISVHETRTSQVIRDVLVQRSQVGILYVSDINHTFMHRLFSKNAIEFNALGDFPPYAYISRNHPLAGKKELTVEELAKYPYVKYEQGPDSYHFSEEIVIPDISAEKTVYVTDRSTMLTIIGNTDAYNMGSGCLLPDIAGGKIISIPISNRMDHMQIGWIKLKNVNLPEEMQEYINLLPQALTKCSWGKGC